MSTFRPQIKGKTKIECNTKRDYNHSGLPPFAPSSPSYRESISKYRYSNPLNRRYHLVVLSKIGTRFTN